MYNLTLFIYFFIKNLASFIYPQGIVGFMGELLVPYDGSEVSKKALYKAAEMTKDGDRLTVIHVIPQLTEFTSLDPGLTISNAMEMVDKALSDFRARGLTVASLVKIGDIVDEILKAASELKCSLIVIGSTGKSTEKIGRFLLGSVAEKVSRHAACPVLIVR